MSADPRMSVVICSLNGADGVDRCLRALARQTIAADLEVIVVDDGSTDGTADVGHRHGAHVVRHVTNRGLSAARNSGIRAASAPVVGFLDDDTEPHADWAEHLLSAYGPGVAGVGGVVESEPGTGVLARYLTRNNPLEPLEIELAESESLPYRLRLYLKRQWSGHRREGRRPAYGLVGANMSFRRDALLQAGLFDERFTFGAEELDLCKRIQRRQTGGLVIEPRSVVTHHFHESLRDTLRRAKAYGVGSARMYRKWPCSRPTLFPVPVVVAALAAIGIARRPALAAAVLLPPLMFTESVRGAVTERDPEHLIDAYLQTAQEAAGNVGFALGYWRFRDFDPVTTD
jgi:glycosyltransferase involved in cell wall biosynthesis